MSKKPGVTAFSVHPGCEFPTYHEITPLLISASGIDIPETSLQSSNGVDMDLLIEGYKIGVERNGGMFNIQPFVEHY